MVVKQIYIYIYIYYFIWLVLEEEIKKEWKGEKELGWKRER